MESTADAYEALPDNIPASVHMLAGASAGILEHCIMYPVDCVKTRMQALNINTSAHYTGISNALRTITAKEGFLRLWTGMPAVAAGAGPAHAMYFACYEKVKWMLSESKQGSTGAAMVAGGSASLFHDGIMVPADVIKQRMQMYNSPYRSMFQCVSSVVRNEGLRALYRSYTTQITMNIPFHILYVSVYEGCQNQINYDREYKPLTHVISGGVAGGMAAFITNPIDVCKTLLNTQEVCCNSGKAADRGLIQALRTVDQCRMYHATGGLGSYTIFFKGAWARTIYQMPSAGISWFFYEWFKSYYSGQKSSDQNEYEDNTDNIPLNPARSRPSLISPVYANDSTTPYKISTPTSR